MQRRAALRRLARLGAIGAVVGVAGCGSSDPQNPGTGGAGGVPTGSDTGNAPDQSAPDDPGNVPFSVADFSYEETADGELRVSVTVANDGGGEATGTVLVVVTVGQGSDATTSEDRTELTIGAGAEKTVAAEFGVSYDAFASRGSIRFRFE